MKRRGLISVHFPCAAEENGVACARIMTAMFSRWMFRFSALLVAGTACGNVMELVPVYRDLVFDDNASAAALVPDDSGRVVVGLQRGQVRVLPADRLSKDSPMFLDLRAKLKDETEFEEGLHGLAFHPDFKKNRRVYLSYSQHDPRRTVLSEFIVPPGEALKADANSERVLLEYPHPIGNHWGGGLAFGPDGFLYLGIGDGGLRDDPYRLGQNLWSLHGKILRLDVDSRTGGLAYGIPKDNPFADRQEVRNEIWAYGFRNPWGMAFDPKTGNLWCADVGQDKWEEINVVKRGGNFGWSEREGKERFAARAGDSGDGMKFIDPVHAYPHTDGISVTGGYVYRGERLSTLKGNYLFSDWGMGKVWALRRDGGGTKVRLLFEKGKDDPAFNPTVFTADAAGEPLIFSQYPSIVYTLEEKRDAIADGSEDAAPEPPFDDPAPVEEIDGEAEAPLPI